MNHFLCKNCECIGKDNYSNVMIHKFENLREGYSVYKKDGIKCDREEYMQDIKRCSLIIPVGMGLGQMCYIETDRGFETHIFSYDTGFNERETVGDIVQLDNELCYCNNEPVQKTILRSVSMGNITESILGNKEILNIVSDISQKMQNQQLNPMDMLMDMLSDLMSGNMENGPLQGLIAEIDMKINNGEIDKDIIESISNKFNELQKK